MGPTVREEIRGGVRTATATSAIAAGATSLNVGVGELSTWTFTTGNRFPVVINAGRADEEHVYATAVSGDSLTGLVRGQDGTLDQPHASGFTVQHGLFAKHIDLLNEFLSLPAAKGDLVVASAVDEWIALTVGANGAVLKANSAVAGGLEWVTTLGGLTLTTATLTAPTIADFTNAAHDHLDTDDGGVLAVASIPALSTDWLDYVPVWTNLTVGDGTVIAKQKQIGRSLDVNITLTFGATTVVSGPIRVGLGIQQGLGVPWTGTATACDSSASARYSGLAVVEGNLLGDTDVDLCTHASPCVSWDTTVPFTWATGDVLSFTMRCRTNG